MSSRLLKVADWEKVAAHASFKPETMASVCSVTLRQLERFFKLQFGQSPSAWSRELRCRLAVTLISTGYSTKATAKELGFASPSHFCHAFKTVYMISPQSFAPGAGDKMSP